MIKTFNEVLGAVKAQGMKTVAVAVAQDEPVLEAIRDAKKNGIANAILVGDKEEIISIASNIGLNVDEFEIIDEKNVNKASLTAVELVSSGRADMMMKGLVDTATFLRAVLNKEVGLRTGKQMSHVAVFEIPGYDRLIFLTDAAFIMYPELNENIDILKTKAAKKMRVNESEIKTFKIAKESIDARKKNNIKFNYAVLVKMDNETKIVARANDKDVKIEEVR